MPYFIHTYHFSRWLPNQFARATVVCCNYITAIPMYLFQKMDEALYTLLQQPILASVFRCYLHGAFVVENPGAVATGFECDSSFQIGESGREQVEQIIEIIAGKPDIVRERVHPVNDHDPEIGAHGQQVDTGSRMEEYASKDGVFR